MKKLKYFLHILFPKLCTTSYRWDNDWLVCSKCGGKLGFKYILPDTCLDYDRNTGQIVYRDNSETRIMLFNRHLDRSSVLSSIKN